MNNIYFHLKSSQKTEKNQIKDITLVFQYKKNILFFYGERYNTLKFKSRNQYLYPGKKMIRIYFNKTMFSKPINESLMFLEVQNQNGQLFKIKPKRIKGNIAKIYGDFVQVEGNYSQLFIKVYVSQSDKNYHLLEKLLIEKNSYGFNQKKSHIIEKESIRIFFDSQIIKDTDSSAGQNEEEFSNYIGNGMLPQRFSLKKQMRGFSPDQRKVLERFSSHYEKNLRFKNATFIAVSRSIQEKQQDFYRNKFSVKNGISIHSV